MLDERKKEIINILINNKKFTTIEQLAHKLKTSNRTIRYDLDSIDIWLDSNDFPMLIRVPRKGIKLNIAGGELNELRKHFTHSNYYEYVLSPEERRDVILLELLKSNKPLTFSILAEKMFVSITTIYNDLNYVEDWLNKFNIKIIRKTGFGMVIEGKEEDKRQAIATLLKSLAIPYNRRKDTSNDSKNYIDYLKDWFPRIDFEYIKNMLCEVEDLLEIKFSYEGFNSLLFHIGLTVERISSNQAISINNPKLKEMMNKSEYIVASKLSQKLSQYYNIEIPKEEIAYITLHIIASKLSDVEDNEKYFEKNSLLSLVIDQMIESVETELNIEIENTNRLKRDLYIHLNPTINRLMFNKPLQNPLLTEIKNKYNDIFLASSKASEFLEESFNIKVTEHEIAYITMHFGAAIESQSIHPKEYTKILLVCGSGIGTSRLLSIKLKSHFKNFKIVNILSHENVNKYKDNIDFDLIISTIPIENVDKPVALVSPLLDAKDIDLLSSYLNYKRSHKYLSYTSSSIVIDLINIISEHCEIKNMQGLQWDISTLLNNVNRFMDSQNSNIESRFELLPKKLIQVNIEAKDWIDAIKKASIPLIHFKYITEEYIDSIIKRIEKYGPYMVIAPGIAMPHSSPEDGALKTGLSITKLKTPVKFNHKVNDPIHTIIMLSATDNYNHIETLTKILEILSDKVNSNILENSQSTDIIYKLFSREVKK
ncbi:BglG family transcription antiterminator [Senegalia massiliensis]|uniref:BglG family transcription antiterminator n=1 Tax=Senegalia massiliensis TaxID=1720316 RepID=UPI001032004A|nr:BglG family transcription antiterminator [Senegalia massiliensis]